MVQTRQWECREEKLSDAFEQKTDHPELELTVTMLNINIGKNRELMERCKPLFEYMQYVEKVRNYTSIMDIRLAVEKAVNECIQEGILAEFLLKNKAEAIQMSIFEYDEEKEMKIIRQDLLELGKKEGIKESIRYFILDNLGEQIPEDRIVTKLQKYFGVLPDEGRSLIYLYGKQNASM